MTENEKPQNLEDNLDNGKLHYATCGIYDLLTLIASKLVGPEDVAKMVRYHDQGFLLGPAPSFTPSENEETIS
jgi:hypothetical protein